MTVASDILSGKLDAELGEIGAAIKTRHAHLREIKTRQARKGQRVRFNARVRPAYLVGVEAIVVEALYSRVAVEVVPEHKGRAGRYGYGPVRTSPELYDVIAEPGAAPAKGKAQTTPFALPPIEDVQLTVVD